MNHELQQKLIVARDEKLSAITKYFLNTALEGHLSGSLSKGTSDALSDLDLWFTFDDNEIKKITEQRFEIFGQFGNIVMFHEAQQNFPLNGTYTLIIYETPAGLLQVDYFLCPLSSARIAPDSTVLFEKIPVARGEMIYDPKRIKKEFSDKVSFVICMCFVAIKKIIRGDTQFMDFLMSEYMDVKTRMFTTLPEVHNDTPPGVLKDMLTNLRAISTPEQQNGIEHIQKFIVTVGI